MPKQVYVNVEDHRLLDGKYTCEDVTKVGLPTITHPTTTISSAGMVMDVDMPNTVHLNAMEMTITHNNGVNCNLLCNPGQHKLEFRAVRQRYNVSKGIIEHCAMKYFITAVHSESQKGDIETGSPYGTTEKYSILKYEEVLNGKTVTLIDATAGKIEYNGREYTSVLDQFLS